MKERPILFQGEMVRAILDGRKTQTRRVLKVQPYADGCAAVNQDYHAMISAGPDYGCRNPYGAPGDRLWVKETFAKLKCNQEEPCLDCQNCRDGRVFRADDHHRAMKWKPSIFMPRWASRITLEITGVRVERLQDITETDARAEGVEPYAPDDGRYVLGYRELWEAINGPGSWAKNPWVWVIEFRRL